MTMTANTPSRRPRPSPLGARLTLAPTLVIALVCFYASIGWTVLMSFTPSRLLPDYSFAGTMQYERLFATPRWEVAFSNMFLFGGLFITACLILGFLLAAALDRKIMLEGTLRSIFLYPFALSFIVAGLAWQWLLNPAFGAEKVLKDLGFANAKFDWIVDPHMAIYTIMIAGVWRNAGLIMALFLAGLRGINPEIWRATRIEGIPAWRVYLQIIIPMLRPTVLTAVVLLATSVVTSYDLVVAMTAGGPGYATDLPGKFVVDFLFKRSNLGLASAAAVVMLTAIVGALAPYFVLELRRTRA
jgi:glucose/mannose transport system permease protein